MASLRRLTVAPTPEQLVESVQGMSVGDDEIKSWQARLSQKQNELDSLKETLNQQAAQISDSNIQRIYLQRKYDYLYAIATAKPAVKDARSLLWDRIIKKVMKNWIYLQLVQEDTDLVIECKREKTKRLKI